MGKRKKVIAPLLLLFRFKVIESDPCRVFPSASHVSVFSFLFLFSMFVFVFAFRVCSVLVRVRPMNQI